MKAILKILLILFPIVMFAQGSGSLYSRYGAGEVINHFSARQLGLGAIGVTSGETYYLNFINPASYSSTKIVRFETGINFYGMNISDDDAKAFYAGSEFSGFGMALPLERSLGITLTFGMVPVTTVQYKVEEDFVGDGYAVRYSGSGGISKAFIGTSYKLPMGLSLGLTFNYFTGNIEYNSIVDYKYDSNNLSSTFTKIHNYRGTGFTFGLETDDCSSVFNSESIKDLKFGLVVNYTKDLPTDTTSIIKLQNTPGIERTAQVDTRLPVRIDGGFSFLWNENKRVMADFSYQPWDKYEIGNQNFSNLKASNRIGLGIEFIGERSPFVDTHKQMDFRFGIAYENTHLKVQGENINQISLHGGFSYPIGNMSTLDVGLQIGQRGTEDNGLMKEMFYKANFSLSIGEVWFIRIER